MILNKLLSKNTKLRIRTLLFYILYIISKFISNKHIDLKLIKLLIKFKNQKKNIIKKILDKNKDMPEFAIYNEILERIEIFGDDYKDSRIDFDKNHYDKMINLIKNLTIQFPKEPNLFDRLSRTYIAKGDKINAKKTYNHALKLQREKLNYNHQPGLIVFISMPRSGTGFVSNAILNGMKLNDLRNEYKFSDAWFPEKAIFPFDAHLSSPYFLPMKNGFVSGHAPASFENLSFLDHLTDKTVVNFRDPRQSLISWVHYMKYLQYTGNYSAIFEYKIDDNYFMRSFEYQIDWQIDNFFLETNINWIKNWLEVKNNNYFDGEILYLNYELLVDNMDNYFSKILNFYNLDTSIFTMPKKPNFKNKSHLRKGDKNEWKQVLTNEQISKINNYIPESWFKEYKWDKYV